MKKIFDKILDPILYLVFSFSIAFSACTIFQSVYYKGIWVTGTSMEPTLTGSVLHSYGYEDKHDWILDKLERFDVITTFWPDEWNNDRPDESDKIKRLWGLPNETISLDFDELHFTFTATTDSYRRVYKSADVKVYPDIKGLCCAEFSVGRRIFKTKIYNNAKSMEDDVNRRSAGVRRFTVELGDNEYFVMGDNWIESNDSYKHVVSQGLCNIQRKNLQGKVICIQGVAKYDYSTGKLYDREKSEPRYYF